MTVGEAIELLKTFPQDLRLIHTMCSDYMELEPDDFTVISGKQDYDKGYAGLAVHRGHIMKIYKRWLKPGDPEPDLIDAVHISGN